MAPPLAFLSGGEKREGSSAPSSTAKKDITMAEVCKEVPFAGTAVAWAMGVDGQLSSINTKLTRQSEDIQDIKGLLERQPKRLEMAAWGAITTVATCGILWASYRAGKSDRQ